jgi:hypothetical protein
MFGTSDTAGRRIVWTVGTSRSDLLKQVARWTYGRKIRLCKGLSAKAITSTEVILAHGLTQDEIDRWMEAYRRKDFEALKVGYARKHRVARKIAPSSWPKHRDTVASG